MIINSKDYFNENIKVKKTYKIKVVDNNSDQDKMISYFEYFSIIVRAVIGYTETTYHHTS